MINIYAFCDNNCKHLVYTREEVLSLLQQAINDGSLKNIDADYAAVKSVVDSNAGSDITFWTGTEAEFNALNPAPKVNHFIPRRGEDGKIYICIDDTSISNLPSEPLTAADVKAICEGTYVAGVGDYMGSEAAGALYSAIADVVGAAAKTATGNYTGTGTYGSAKPNTLTFDFVPKIIFFGDGSGTGYLNKWIVGSGSNLIVYDGNGASLSNTGSYSQASGYTTYRTSVISISGTTISWYSSSNYTSEYNAQCAQMNYSGRKYYYIAIG